MIAGLAGDLLFFALALVDAAAAIAVVAVAADTATTVQFDAITTAGDTVLVARAGAGRRGGRVGERGEGRWGGDAGAAGGQAGGNAGGGADVAELHERSSLEFVTEVIDADWRMAVVGLTDLAGFVGLGWLGSNNSGGRQSSALGDLARFALRGSVGGTGGAGDIENVQGALGAGLHGGFLVGVVSDLEVVDDVLYHVKLVDVYAAHPAQEISQRRT